MPTKKQKRKITKEKRAITLSTEVVVAVEHEAETKYGGNLSKCIETIISNTLICPRALATPTGLIVELVIRYTPTQQVEIEKLLATHRLKDRQDRLLVEIFDAIVDGKIKLPE